MVADICVKIVIINFSLSGWFGLRNDPVEFVGKRTNFFSIFIENHNYDSLYKLYRTYGKIDVKSHKNLDTTSVHFDNIMTMEKESASYRVIVRAAIRSSEIDVRPRSSSPGTVL